MTIRKRYDEAQDLMDRGHHEPALILLLVAISAASERRRKFETNNSRKKFGDDSKWFKHYIDTKMLPILLDFENGTTITSSEALYKDLRCELIHEAKARDGSFNTDLSTMSINDGRFIFGIGLLRDLSHILANDTLGRDEFRDLLHPFKNIVEFSGPYSLEGIKLVFNEKYGLSPGRIDVIICIITALTPERINISTNQELGKIFTYELIPDMAHANLNEGCLTGLRHTQIGPLLSNNYELTTSGFIVLRELSSFFKTTDPARR